jgi:UDP-2-acetamido-2,6-beta-L-arabino-hexul-4-ose reductase
MSLSMRKILVTGANGFIGRNLISHLKQFADIQISTFVRGDDSYLLNRLVSVADAVIHLAGENRPSEVADFKRVNSELTNELCMAVKSTFENTGRQIPIVFSSSVQAELGNPYGQSKLAAETALKELSAEIGGQCSIFRLPGVFGKWCKPNYNSVVATFCHNISRDIPIRIENPGLILNLAYIDDVVTAIRGALNSSFSGCEYYVVEPVYAVSIEKLANHIRTFKLCRSTLATERVGIGFLRALYATYMSHLPNEWFSYEVKKYVDSRGEFVEMLKTPDCGQFSYFTAHPGITRGGHYHHTKSEKFLVIKGQARFKFRHMCTGEAYELTTSGEKAEIVESVPGWTHDITNIGTDEMIVMLWANEVFDRQRPDTFACSP